MSVDTKGKILGKYQFEDIKKVIEKFADEVEIQEHTALQDVQKSAHINFKYKNKETGEIEKRNLFVLENCKGDHENDKIKQFVGNKNYTYCSLGMWGDSVDIMNNIIKNFEGLVIRNDCADDSKEDFVKFFSKNKKLDKKTKDIIEKKQEKSQESYKDVEISFF
jgi:hypothetical protein